MKERQKYRVVKRYGTYRVGDIITPNGMLRHELTKLGRIEKYDEATEPSTAPLQAEPAPVIEEAPVPPCDDDDIADDIDEDEDDSPLIETAEAPQAVEAVMQKRGRGRPRRV